MAPAERSVAQESQRTATWQRPGHPDVTVSLVDGRWVVTGGVIESRAAETPAQALVLFARAVNTMDASLLRSLMPTEERAFWSVASAGELLRHPEHRPALLSLLEGISSQAPPTTPPDGVATVTVGEPSVGQIVFVREQDGWKILDLQPHEGFLPPPDSQPSGGE